MENISKFFLLFSRRVKAKVRDAGDMAKYFNRYFRIHAVEHGFKREREGVFFWGGDKVIKAVRFVKDFKGIRVVIYVKDSITYIKKRVCRN